MTNFPWGYILWEGSILKVLDFEPDKVMLADI